MKRQLATRGGRIEGLVQAAEANAVLLQPRHPGDQILEGAAKSVQPPDHQGILGSQDLLELRQPRPLGHRATHAIHNDLRTARLPEGVLLELEVLILRRHPRIAVYIPAPSSVVENSWRIHIFFTLFSYC